MNEFEMLARQGYPHKRLVEMAGGDWIDSDTETCPDCGAPWQNCDCGWPDEEAVHRAPEPPEEPPYCDVCGSYGHDSFEWQKCPAYFDEEDD